ncbi:DUF2252 domain-containing protein [Fructilactobacillus fructivorans]|uniref:DUF2252 domain-containing protein n=1 Tax=Fructilactobacillus fructivorans TaxID=1614 RepID=A0A0C1M6W0_9LACO|nr:DUF2252 domain-containing protein [Fructilactobacillus fructivorans]KID42049.1 hypothetical protein LfDm3_0717 [Fructilactobacillus fructivorans]MCT0151704.1 DUF2252 domain-containing protein [Fructilactobacillus fructivorans]MCT2867167.1 DUF2252 domain-containing protein [Fructilactobacillus fructivorans]MCT2868272.1 DUF2252 domain-containing protein [Fructilactobacillus fructivorans]MCT2872980.1 DUF2252 domain-containing protein [Fructilactobacillus fructivorans]
MKLEKKSPYGLNNVSALLNDVSMNDDQLIHAGEKMSNDANMEAMRNFKAKKRDIKPILTERDSLLLSGLLGLKRERMAKNPFSFYRGSVELMNHDLERIPMSDINLLIAGDAHLGNFGFYGSPEHQLLFDLNDFDESHVGHFEDDLLRFMVSALLVAKQQGFDIENEVNPFLRDVLDTYRSALVRMTEIPAMDKLTLPNSIRNISKIFGTLKDGEKHFKKSFQKITAKSINKALRSTSDYAVEKYTTVLPNGERQFIDNEPVTVHIGKKDYQKISDGLDRYYNHTKSDIRFFLSNFQIVDIVRHSVGVGSVGTLCFLVLLEDANNNYLVLQIKQALPIYKNNVIGMNKNDSLGENIVDCQLILQTASDPFLGWFNTQNKSYYVRQFKDMKGSVNLNKLDLDAFKDYVLVCVILLARAHSQSPTFPMIIGYLKNSDKVKKSFIEFANEYMKQVEMDYHTFIKDLK